MDFNLENVFNESESLVDLINKVCAFNKEHGQSGVTCTKILERVKQVYELGDMAKDISPWGIAETRTGMQPTSFGVDYHQSNANLITPQYIAQAKEAWPQLSNKYATGCADCGTLKIQNER
ncbi:hypothetical protein COT72_01885 [archaeon CG10_big_fil_rev_8_21_14_0_10_43_11]|nr:MAG: hypothetical protein COT72_01885 [archaeon CG10_big_fil_rev_8_21_14_0_10_43_11]